MIYESINIKDSSEKKYIFAKMLRISKPSIEFPNPAEAFEIFFSWIEHWYWTKIILDEPIPEIYSDYYYEIYGLWNHSKNHNCNKHYILGTSFVYWAEYYCGIKFILGDCPDLQGKLDNMNIWGDIGMVGIPTFFDTIRGYDKGTLWISVLDARTQILLECPYNFCKYISKSRNLSVL